MKLYLIASMAFLVSGTTALAGEMTARGEVQSAKPTERKPSPTSNTRDGMGGMSTSGAATGGMKTHGASDGVTSRAKPVSDGASESRGSSNVPDPKNTTGRRWE
jgi:hypothetical protein